MPCHRRHGAFTISASHKSCGYRESRRFGVGNWSRNCCRLAMSRLHPRATPSSPYAMTTRLWGRVYRPQHRLNFLPLLHGHFWFLPSFLPRALTARPVTRELSTSCSISGS